MQVCLLAGVNLLACLPACLFRLLPVSASASASAASADYSHSARATSTSHLPLARLEPAAAPAAGSARSVHYYFYFRQNTYAYVSRLCHSPILPAPIIVCCILVNLPDWSISLACHSHACIEVRWVRAMSYSFPIACKYQTLHEQVQSGLSSCILSTILHRHNKSFP